MANFEILFLNPLKGGKKLKEYSVMDLESDNSWINCKLVGFYNGKTFRQFSNIKDFLEYFFKTQESIPCYIHYLSYDGMFIIEELMRQKIFFEIVYRNKILCIKIHINNKKYEFRDSFSLLPSSLKTLTNDFNVEHKKLNPNSFAEAYLNPVYNKYDCLGLYEVLQKFFEILDYEISLTLASTSMRYFRTHYLKESIYRNRNYEPKIRESYFGARNEINIFNLDLDKKFYNFDINSLYPFSMKETYFPIGKLEKERNNIEDEGISFVNIEENNNFPILPIREDKLYFINGKKQGFYTNLELRYAKENGVKFEVLYSLVSKDSDLIFKEFVTKLYDQRLRARKDNNLALAFTLKLLMNSLYGKFGQAQEISRIFFNDDQLDLEGAIPLNEFNSAFRKVEQKEFAYSIPIIASYVTARGRIELHKKISSVDSNSIYYWDTDSVITDKNQFENSNELGKFKLENVITDFLMFMPKLYFYKVDEKIRLKNRGVSIKEGEDEFSESEKLKNAIDFITVNKVEMKRGIKSLVVSLKNQENEKLVFEKTTVKSFVSEYDKRFILDDYSTKPFLNIIEPNKNYKKLKKELVKKFNIAYVKK